MLLISAVVIFLTLPLLIMMIKSGIPGKMTWLIVAVMAAPVAVIVVYFTDFPRLYLYLAILVAGIIQSEFLLGIIGIPFNSLLAFGLPGVAVLAFGIALLVKFIRKYPLSPPEVANAG